MFGGTQEPVRPGQGRGVLAADVSPVGERSEPVQRRAGPERLVRPAVHELQQLDGEFDVAQATAPELELAIGDRRGQ